MSAPGRWAPDNDEGLHAYVVTTHEWGRSSDRIEYAESLMDAKRDYGWTRMLHVTKRVRRALPADLQEKP